MKIKLLLFAQIINCTNIICQTSTKNEFKPPLDFTTFTKWPSIGIRCGISNDGNYVIYTIQGEPIGKNTLVLQSIKTNWKKEVVGVSDGEITQDSKTVIFLKGNDTLCLFGLESLEEINIPKVSSFQLFQNGKEEWLAYQLKNETSELRIQNLTRGTLKSYFNVLNYLFSPSADKLLVKRNFGASKSSIQLFSFPNGDSSLLSKNAKLNTAAFDASGTQVVFIVEDTVQGKVEKHIYYYKDGMSEPKKLTNHFSQSNDGYIIERLGFPAFNRKGDIIFFTASAPLNVKPKSGFVPIDVWHYAEPKLQSQQLKELATHSFVFIINLANNTILRVQNENEIMNLADGKDYEIAEERKGNRLEQYWNASSVPTNYLVNLKNAQKRIISMRMGRVSPQNKYVVGWDSLSHDLFCYDIFSGKYKNITRNIPIPQVDSEYDDRAKEKPRAFSLGPWMENDSRVIVYDRYDLWLVDPSEPVMPINLTNGYGRKHHFVFRLANEYKNQIIENENEVLLSAFDLNNKNNGFYKLFFTERKDPQKLFMGPYVFHMPGYIGLPVQYPKKAKDAQVYLVRRESAIESANYFITSDFKTFKQISFVAPEKKYNWLKSELHTWKSLNGESFQGILYKPENFAKNRKYSVIMNYYEKKSYGLNKYIKPQRFQDDINIPWFVSNGYVVFVPDIKYKQGKTGESVVNCLVSAANYLSKFSWVNKNKIGIEGHSFGGYETSYLITRTNLFAAAISSAGFVDLISRYGSVTYSTGAAYSASSAEAGQSRIGASLWERPDLYLKNSPILGVNKITTPLLMMNNIEDGIVNFSDGIEFFTALRRMGKRAWMLQYDGEGHSIIGEKAKLDYTIRMIQFFDHYLKDSACPRWMLYGIPAKDKGIDDGLQLVYEKDKNGKWVTPPEGGLLTDEERKKVEALKHRKPITVTID